MPPIISTPTNQGVGVDNALALLIVCLRGVYRDVRDCVDRAGDQGLGVPEVGLGEIGVPGVVNSLQDDEPIFPVENQCHYLLSGI